MTKYIAKEESAYELSKTNKSLISFTTTSLKSKKVDPWYKIQEARIKRIQDGCKNVSDPGITSYINLLRKNVQIRGKLLSHFIVDDKHKVLYCYIPKASKYFFW